jgi:hypothetical protein
MVNNIGCLHGQYPIRLVINYSSGYGGEEV